MAVVLLVAAVQAKTTKPVPKAASSKVKAGASHSSRKTSSRSSRKSKHSKRARSKNWRRHGQQKIDSERAREIQDALIRAHYLNGEASGKWDAATQKAMERYQADNGWQSKTVPDSRALIKLGLGPDHEHLLNPESAMTTAPAAAVNTSSGGAKVHPVEARPAPDSQPQK
jgi:peptidoglycan hydrolase-like protein with peptidoglycan-binding domain